VFELGKEIVRTTIVTLEARTGRKVEYEDDEARKSGMGDNAMILITIIACLLSQAGQPASGITDPPQVQKTIKQAQPLLTFEGERIYVDSFGDDPISKKCSR